MGRGEGTGWGNGWQLKGSATEHNAQSGDTDKCGDGPREGRGWAEVGKGQGEGTSAIASAIQIELKKRVT